MSAVEWRLIPGYRGRYEVSDQGVIRFTDAAPKRHAGRNISQQVDSVGYLIVSLWDGERHRRPRAHRVVLEVFVGLRPEGMVCRHLNGIKTDNRLSNLCWGTYSQNQFDIIEHGNNPRAAQTHCKHGHEFTPENTYDYSSGNKTRRQCKACVRIRSQAWYAKRAAA